MPELKEASIADIPAIASLAQLIWNQHYPEIIGQKQVDYMLEKMYSDASLHEQMSEKQHRFFLVQLHNAPVGFLSVHHEGNNNWFLNKFYIDQRNAGKGLGFAAFKNLLALIRPAKLTLTCNRQNYKTINFYFKLGFKISRVADFDIGEGYVMNDFVMEWQQPAG